MTFKDDWEKTKKIIAQNLRSQRAHILNYVEVLLAIDELCVLFQSKNKLRNLLL